MTRGHLPFRTRIAKLLLVALAVVGAIGGFASQARAVDVDPRGT